jgi:hypothetical protein
MPALEKRVTDLETAVSQESNSIKALFLADGQTKDDAMKRSEITAGAVDEVLFVTFVDLNWQWRGKRILGSQHQQTQPNPLGFLRLIFL